MPKFIPDKLYNIYRKKFGTYTLEDPRPIARDSPYTFYLPTKDHIKAIRIGDVVKLVFIGKPNGLIHNAERMWVTVTKRNDERLEGHLDNNPYDMPQLKAYDLIFFSDFQIIDIQWNEEKAQNILDNLSKPKSKQKWDRCLVDACIVNDGIEVQYIYRENPDMGSEDDKYPDSGWRIRGDVDAMTDEQYENGTPLYIALGKVLNSDDSFIHLLDAPIGSRFFKNPDSGEFEIDTEDP